MPKPSRSQKRKPRSSDDKYYFDQDCADKWVNWFELFLTHTIGDKGGQSIVLEEWQKEKWIRPLFGWKCKSDGTRRYRTVFIYCPRKNGKSLINAGIGLGMTAIDGEQGARCYTTAATEEQAHELFDMAKTMVLQNPELLEIFEVLEDCIQHKASRSAFRCVSGTPKGKTGSNVHLAIIDEYHEQPNLKLRQIMKTGTASRKQPLLIMVTTAGDDRNSPCYREYTYAKQVRDGVVKNDSYFQLIYEADDEDDPHLVSTWRKANPNFGISVNADTFREIHDESLKSAGEWNTFLQFHLNRWVQKRSRLIPIDKWDACYEPFTAESLYGKPCYGGMDLASIRDLCSFSLLFPDWQRREGDLMRVLYRVLNWNWIPEEGAIEREKDGYPYLDWIQSGFIRTTSGDCTDYEVIRQDINDLGKLFQIVEIGYDPFKSTEIVQNLQDKDGFKMVQVRNGTLTMSPSVDRLEHLIIRNELHHNANSVLTFCVSNVVVTVDHKKNKMLAKERDEEKIDAVTSTVIALTRAVVAKPLAPMPTVEAW